METKQPAMILLGPPASGKGTQAGALAMLPGFSHLSTGRLLREKSQEPGAGNADIRRVLEGGGLLPDAQMLALVRQHLEEQRSAGRLNTGKILILDGIPRTLEQARQLAETHRILRVLVLGYGDEDALRARIRRRALQENRSDDLRDEVIARRIEVYHEETEPLIEHYRTRAPDAIAEVNCLQSPPQVLHDILQSMIPVYETLHGSEIHGKEKPDRADDDVSGSSRG